MLYLYWAKAMDTTDPEDPQVRPTGGYGADLAEQSGYPAPPKKLRFI